MKGLPIKSTPPHSPNLFSCPLYRSVSTAWDFDRFRLLRPFRSFFHRIPIIPYYSRTPRMSSGPIVIYANMRLANPSAPLPPRSFKTQKHLSPLPYPTHSLSPFPLLYSVILASCAQTRLWTDVTDRGSRSTCNIRLRFRGNTIGFEGNTGFYWQF